MTDAIGRQVLDNVRDVIQGLALPRISTSDITIGALPSDEKTIRRGITITPQPEGIDDSSPVEGTNVRDLVNHKFLVTMVVGNPHGWSENITSVSEWRQMIRRAFNCKRPLTNVSGTNVTQVLCKVQHGQFTLSEDYMRNNNASQMVINCWFLEPREQES